MNTSSFPLMSSRNSDFSIHSIQLFKSHQSPISDGTKNSKSSLKPETFLLSSKVLENQPIRLLALETPSSEEYFSPSLRNYLPDYIKQFTISNWTRFWTGTSKAIKAEMQKIGYASVEDFLTSNPNNLEKSKNTIHKNPREEAILLFNSGGYTEIIQHIEKRHAFYKKEIEGTQSYKEKFILAEKFVDEMTANEIQWFAFLKNEGFKYIS